MPRHRRATQTSRLAYLCLNRQYTTIDRVLLTLRLIMQAGYRRFLFQIATAWVAGPSHAPACRFHARLGRRTSRYNTNTAILRSGATPPRSAGRSESGLASARIICVAPRSGAHCRERAGCRLPRVPHVDHTHGVVEDALPMLTTLQRSKIGDLSYSPARGSTSRCRSKHFRDDAHKEDDKCIYNEKNKSIGVIVKRIHRTRFRLSKLAQEFIHIRFPGVAAFVPRLFLSLFAAVAHKKARVSRFAIAAIDNASGAIHIRFENPDAPFSEATTAF